MIIMYKEAGNVDSNLVMTVIFSLVLMVCSLLVLTQTSHHGLDRMNLLHDRYQITALKNKLIEIIIIINAITGLRGNCMQALSKKKTKLYVYIFNSMTLVYGHGASVSATETGRRVQQPDRQSGNLQVRRGISIENTPMPRCVLLTQPAIYSVFTLKLCLQ